MPKGSIMNRAYQVTKWAPKSLSPTWAELCKQAEQPRETLWAAVANRQKRKT